MSLACFKKNFFRVKAKLQYKYKPENQSKLLELQQMHLSMATLLWDTTTIELRLIHKEIIFIQSEPRGLSVV